MSDCVDVNQGMVSDKKPMSDKAVLSVRSLLLSGLMDHCVNPLALSSEPLMHMS